MKPSRVPSSPLVERREVGLIHSVLHLEWTVLGGLSSYFPSGPVAHVSFL